MLHRLGTTNVIRYTPLPKGMPPTTIAQRKELLKGLVAKQVQTLAGELVDDDSLVAGAGWGREFRIKLKEGYVQRGQFWLMEHMQFQLIAVGPGDLIDTAISRRFFESFSYKAPADAPVDSKDADSKDADSKDADSKDKDTGDSNGAKPGEASDNSSKEQDDHERHETHENK